MQKTLECLTLTIFPCVRVCKQMTVKHLITFDNDCKAYTTNENILSEGQSEFSKIITEEHGSIKSLITTFQRMDETLVFSVEVYFFMDQIAKRSVQGCFCIALKKYFY